MTDSNFCRYIRFLENVRLRKLAGPLDSSKPLEEFTVFPSCQSNFVKRPGIWLSNETRLMSIESLRSCSRHGYLDTIMKWRSPRLHFILARSLVHKLSRSTRFLRLTMRKWMAMTNQRQMITQYRGGRVEVKNSTSLMQSHDSPLHSTVPKPSAPSPFVNSSTTHRMLYTLRGPISILELLRFVPIPSLRLKGTYVNFSQN